MSKKRKPYEKKSFESMRNSSDTSANIYESMLLSPAWLALSATQKVLYVVCKSQFYSEKRNPNNNSEQFTMNKFKWLNKYHLYTNANSAGFYRDMNALIEKGFIACVECGANTRTKSIYKFSDKWNLYKKAEFKILPSEMTMGMLRKLNKTRQPDYHLTDQANSNNKP
jgi:ribosomal protein L33